MPTVIQMRVWRQGGGPPTVQLGQQRCFCLGLPPPQTSLSGQDSISKLRNLGSIQPHIQTWVFTNTHNNPHWCTLIQSLTNTHTHTTLLINAQITPPIITTLVLIRNYLKHFPIRVYMLSWAGVCLNNPTVLFFYSKTVTSFINMHAREHTQALQFLDLTVVIRLSQRVPLLQRWEGGGGGWGEREERERNKTTKDMLL